MRLSVTRRRFLKATGATGAALGLGDFSFLSRLPSVSAAEAKLDPKIVRFDSGIEPLVRLLEDTPREKLLEEVGARIQRGLAYRDVLAGLLLAGVRNIQPRPVGFKFHAVLVVNSAHLASISSPDSDRWLPIFWALDQFKSSQAQDVREGNWTMGPVEESKVPPADKARHAFAEAMDNWDEAGADAAVVGLARAAEPREVFEIFCRYGARDFREIGHKAIYVANSWRTLQFIGWQHAEPVLRSLAYALLDHDGENPAKRNAAPDRPWRRNQTLAAKIRGDWLQGKADPDATTEMLATLRDASPDEACDKVVELLNRGNAPQSLWDAFFDAGGEWLMRRPGIVSLHAVTSANALHFAFETSRDDLSRRLLLLQAAAFSTLFRGDAIRGRGLRIDQLEPAALKASGAKGIEEIFADVSGERMLAARKVLAYLKENPQAKEFIAAARRLIFLKGNNAHDYKFSSAVLEDYQNVSPAWRDRYLAASVFNLRGSGGADNDLVKRTRAALGA
ncbi:MAG: twin-arginine translocation signal domain-containing protein [Verrucomicrobia bacterium]|nr:twin-arginine translocation signal domain-containing protein [Verrucomicrobiota bacterium]